MWYEFSKCCFVYLLNLDLAHRTVPHAHPGVVSQVCFRRDLELLLHVCSISRVFCILLQQKKWHSRWRMFFTVQKYGKVLLYEKESNISPLEGFARRAIF